MLLYLLPLLHSANQVLSLSNTAKAGDNVKSGFPMISWSVIEFGRVMKGELQNANESIGATNYILKGTAHPNTFIFRQDYMFMDCPKCLTPVTKGFGTAHVAVR
ncbi:hypothetical protein HHK36_014979 [Tetracentron sinense]|uniref:Uncharacterized protein n=1 Tax=Tetracentron sinense TaxID=13715 RepID=A0A834YZY6_TETSI|nr:hypothetical protein HHK36_014979 [Tetracentron sinense]